MLHPIDKSFVRAIGMSTHCSQYLVYIKSLILLQLDFVFSCMVFWEPAHLPDIQIALHQSVLQQYFIFAA